MIVCICGCTFAIEVKNTFAAVEIKHGMYASCASCVGIINTIDSPKSYREPVRIASAEDNRESISGKRFPSIVSL